MQILRGVCAALSFTALFDSGCFALVGGWRDGVGCGLSGMEENKKSGGGDVRADALSWAGEWV